MKVITSDHRDLKTERQWAKEGFLVRSGEVGEQLWTNCYCQHKGVYFDTEQVRPATPEEIYAFFEPERKARRESQNKRRERIRREKEREEELQRRISERRIKTQQGLELPVVEIANASGIVCFDLETTGKDCDEDEILQFSAIDGDGNVLLDTLVRPYIQTAWRGAQSVHGISPEDVTEAPQLHELIPTIRGIFQNAKLLVSYNGRFDLDFLCAAGIDIPKIEHVDVMEDFAEIYGEWNEYYGNYKWQSLSTCAAYYGYKFTAHDSLEDAKATLYCYKQMINNEG